ncbi:MAG: zinc ribbon domain-containing protein [Caldilineaceae bacterium SB0670_bin_27]|uniref:Zinc ribbon domain-containing protein n=1 Tax=Caldilineaceae bacterium SB0664_bin_27 TaxID=2605260 RepID=A0A6B0YR62_9CHLR|nr:zinc ribbon domain-containing protein [Caldilineaceae bacterium SB0664_bin_27]MYJ78818.1 zinc ribbon domain-containing protein [Caldilineaceae bacterium SB0670_bin_27]
MATFDCPHCGYSNPVASQFCLNCGTNLVRRQPQSAPAGESPDEPDDLTGGQETAPPQPGEASEGRQSSAEASDPGFSQTGSDRPSADEDATPETGKDKPEPDTARPGPLLGDLGGLLEPADPLSFITSGAGALDPTRDSTTALSGELTTDEEERRQLRQLFSEDLPLPVGARPDLTPDAAEAAANGNGLQRQFWLEMLLLLVMIGALLWGGQPSLGAAPHALPGLEQVHRQIDTLPPNSLVLVNWAYDPASAGEMDLLAQPLIEHLLQRQAKIIVFSQLPGGPATARRVIARAEESLKRPSRTQITANLVIEGGYLPGGAASLPLLGVAPARALPVDPNWVDLRERFSIAALSETGPALTLVIAARAEDVRRWLEQVQPLNDGTVVAATSAVAGPAVRPYLHSGQLAGLVSGWDGGSVYVRRLERARNPAEQGRSLRLVSGQNWGVGILIVAVLLGNLAGLNQRRSR